MKKLISAILLSVMALTLTACGNAGGSQSEPPQQLDLTAFYDTMFNEIFPDPDNAPAMEQITGDYLAQLYPGLSELETKQCLVYAPMISAVAYEVALVEAANADDAAKVKEIFQARIDSQVEGGAFYPGTVEAWQNNSEIVTSGNYVCLFVGDVKDDMVASFNALAQGQ